MMLLLLQHVSKADEVIVGAGDRRRRSCQEGHHVCRLRTASYQGCRRMLFNVV